MEKHTIIITVANRVGVLARISGMLSSRGYNIESIIGAPTENPDTYKIHLVVCGTMEKLEQVTKQLNKLIDIIKLVDISHNHNYIVREYILIQVNSQKKHSHSEIFELIQVFAANVVDVSRDHVTIELAGPSQKIERFIDLLKPFGIKEFVRSGNIAINDT